MSEAAPRMLVSIVNYCTGTLAVECLASLAAEVATMPGLRAIVVDNASGDDSCTRIAAAIAANRWGDWAELICAPINGGFAYGNNLAIKAARNRADPPDLIWLLNPDTRVMPGAATILAAFMRDHPAAGIAGSGLLNENNVPWPYAFRFPSILAEIERGMRLGIVTGLLRNHQLLRPMNGAATPVDWVSGSSMVIRAAIIDAIGMMDEAYFLYFEETDFCRLARGSGWECWYVPQAQVMHLAGQSTGLHDDQPTIGRVPPYWFDSRRRYFVKNHGRLYAIGADMAWIVSYLLWRVHRRLLSRPDPDPPNLLRDFIAGSALRPDRTRAVR
ncbi:glycosyltransferase family 2 protein [Hephaestia sp. GCM10023244]|uniref:glycosyltransferase family 2 protein n=1 Tax=unclassified Hephaestia TaxID=2631281 RepID=UPI00207767E5|nr:glycosyltransferase family 2 protein [Hephaestia sp. MAHUQ-44]MCM8731668.1 glycosyltransferase family 2 protein [Hephaestia sp. MAHUQ-44]